MMNFFLEVSRARVLETLVANSKSQSVFRTIERLLLR